MKLGMAHILASLELDNAPTPVDKAEHTLLQLALFTCLDNTQPNFNSFHSSDRP